MGKSSGGGSAPGGSQTIIQDIAEPFKGFATRSLERAERLQGLPSVPFTGIATAGPTPDELVAAQALRQRFLDADPLSEQALGLQSTAADPILARDIEARRSPFEALIAQEAYRRLDERGQRDLQDLRAREVAAGGTDRGRGAVEASLLKQRQEDQERQIGLEAGQRSFTDAAQLALADRQARGDTSTGISNLLTQRQALQRRDIDDLLKVGAQFREQFIQPELDLERQQFIEERGPASVQNPFGFEQFFSGIRAAAPTPTVQTTQNFKQTPSGLSQAAPIIGAGLGVAGQFIAEGGEINFDEGGIASFARGQKVNLTPQEQESQALARIKDFFASIKSNPDAYSPQIMQELLAIEAEFNRQSTGGGAIARGSFADRMRYYESFTDGITNVANPGAAVDSARRRAGRADPRIPTKDDFVSQAVEEQIVEEAPAPIAAEANPGFWERLKRGRIGENPDAPYHDNIMQAILGKDVAGGNRGSVRRGLDGRGQGYDPAPADVRAIARDPFPIPETANQYGQILKNRVGTDADHEEVRQYAGTEGPLVTGSEAAQVRGGQPVGEYTPHGPSWSTLNLPEEHTRGEFTPRSHDWIPQEVEETIEVEDVSPSAAGRDFEQVDAEYGSMYDKSDITAMMQFELTGRGREHLPRHLRHLLPFEMTEHLKPIREKARKASEPRRKKERLERINNRTNFNRRDSGGIGDTGSFEFSDITDFLDFNKGGVASFKEGGIGDLFSSLNPMEGDPLTKALFPEQFKQLQQLKPSFLRGDLEEEEEEISPLQHVENYQESQRQAQRRDRTRRNKRGRRKIETGLSSLNQGGIASFDKGGRLDFSDYDYGMGEEALEAYGYSEVEPKPYTPTQMDKLMLQAIAMNKSVPRDQYYPDAPEMTKDQQIKMALSALSKGLMAIKADPETGITDFGDVGQGVMEGMEGYKDKLQKRRDASVALERQHRQDFMKTMVDLQALETSILSGDKVAGEIALQQFKIDNPWSEATIGLIEAEMQRAANFQGEINVQVIRDGLAALQQLAKSNPQAGPQGLAGVDSALAGLISKKREDQDQPKTR